MKPAAAAAAAATSCFGSSLLGPTTTRACHRGSFVWGRKNKGLTCGIHWWRQQQTQRKRWCSTAANTGPGPNDGNKELLFLNLDLKGMKENQKQLADSIQHRKVEANIGEVVCLFDQTTKLQHQVRALRTRRNLVAKARGKSAAPVTEEEEEEAKQLRAELKGLEEELDAVERRLLSEAKRVPNYIHRDVPVGNSKGGQPQEAKVLRHVGQKPQFTAERPALDHLTLCTKLGLLDLEAGHRVSGNKKFCFLKGAGALLEMALIQCALLHATRHGFTPFTVPELVRHAAAEGAGFQPRDPSPVNQTYALKSSDHCLVATAEIPLAAYYLNCTLPVEKLPLKMVAFSHCFRTEAGSAGIRDKGLYRLHQFSKVEMFAIGTPDMSEQLHEEMLAIEEEFFSLLGLPYRVLDMPAEELGAPAVRKYDIEAWMPGRGDYGEISSTSNCTDFQSRRLNIRCQDRTPQSKKEFVHMVNGTACAVPRTLLAILENNQQEDGSVIVPQPLVPFMGGLSRLQPLPQEELWLPQQQMGAWYHEK